MARKKTNISQPAHQGVIINDLTLVAPDRKRKDIGTLKSSLERAESIQLPNRARLYDLYHDVLSLDGHLSGIIGKRIKAVTNKRIYFADANDRRVEALDDLLVSKKFKHLKKEVMHSVIWGISGVQFITGSQFDFVKIPRKHIRPEKGVIARSQWDNDGIPYAGLSDVWIIGEPDDLGVLLRCSMYALYKRPGLGDMAQYVEIFGQPVRIIYYDTYDTKTRDELKKMAETAGSSLVMMIPKQAQFQMLDGKTSNGNGDLQLKFLSFCNQEMSVAVLGVSETTLSSSSSGYAQSETHADQQLEITKDDIELLLAELNSPQFIAVLKSYGYPVEGGKFVIEKEFDLDKLTKRLAIDKEVSSHVPVSDDYWYETYGIPKPDNYDELKVKQEQQRQAAIDALNSVGKSENQDKDSTPSSQDPAKNDTGKQQKRQKPGLANLFDFFGEAPTP